MFTATTGSLMGGDSITESNISTLTDSSINIAVKPWVKVADYGAAGGEIYQAILDRFRANRVQIPYPQREIRLLNGEGIRKEI